MNEIQVASADIFYVGERLEITGYVRPAFVQWASRHRLARQAIWLERIIRTIARRFGREIWMRRDRVVVETVKGTSLGVKPWNMEPKDAI